ncbi:MAG: PHP domain-containing protein [Limnobacter sp.]|nr:PHP domain-containing protein [Limnobacter sp.]
MNQVDTPHSSLPSAQVALAPEQPGFVHLRMHTEFSVTDGIVRIGEAVAAAAADGMPALALSDLSSLFGLVKFYRKCRASGIKPIAATDIWLESEKGEGLPARCLLVAQNHAGYLQLCELLSRAFLQNQHRAVRWCATSGFQRWAAPT